MATPEFILDLRRRIGHELLLLPGVGALIRNDQSDLLMVRRSDTGVWQVPSGIVEPGEHPAESIVREVGEETGLAVRVGAIAAVLGKLRVTFPNQDVCEFVTTLFRCEVIGGVMEPDGDETTDVRYFNVEDEVVASYLAGRRIPRSVLDVGPAYFDVS